MKAFGVSLKIWYWPEVFTVLGLKGGHTCFFSAVSMQVAENDFGMIAEIVFRKSHFKLISRLPANGTSTLLAKARNWSFDLSGFANWKEEASKDQIFATTEFRTSKKLQVGSFSCSQLLQKCSGFSRMQLWPSLGNIISDCVDCLVPWHETIFKKNFTNFVLV